MRRPDKQGASRVELQLQKSFDNTLRGTKEVVESFEDDRNVQWASKHLRPDTLLSKDELALYEGLRCGDLINKELREWSSNFKSPLTTLSGVRSIFPVKQEVVESFEDDRNVQWASKHLRPDTLLSKDEDSIASRSSSSRTGRVAPKSGLLRIG
jgi:hypothetical protein